MTDLATIRIPVDTSDMVKAVQDTRRFEREIKVLYTAFQNGTINSKQYNAGIVQLRKEFQQLFGVSYQMATNRVRGHAKALEQQAITTKKLIADQKNLNAVMRESATATTRSMKTQNQFGLVTQQVGYQVGDFVVQVQSGTNAFVAFGQQATQLAGLLYLIPGAAGAIAGTVTSILIPTITAALQYFSRTGEEAKTFGDIIKDIAEDVSTFKQIETSLTESLVSPMNRATESLRRYQRARQEEILSGVRTALGETLQPSITMQRDLEERLATRAVRFGPAGERQELEAQLELVRQLNETLAFAEFGNMEELGARLAEAVNALKDANLLTDDMAKSLDSLVLDTGLLAQSQEYYNEQLEKTKKLAEEIEDRNSQILEDRKEDTIIANKHLDELNNEVKLLAVIQEFGAESVQVKDRIAAQEREAFESMVLALRIAEDHREELMAAYDATVLLRGENEAYEKSIARAASSASVLAEKLGISYENARKLLAAGRDPTQEVVLDPRDPRYNPELARMRYVEEEQKRLRDEFSKPLRDKKDPVERLGRVVDLTKELSDAERQRLDLIQSIEGSLESGFMSMVDGTKSVKDAFRSMARDIIAELYRVFVVQRIVGAISGRLFPEPAMLAPGIPVPPPRPANLGVRAAGGSIMPGGSYLVGEKGPEIIRPRHSGTVVPAHLSGQGGSSMTVNNNITVTGSDAANVRMEVAKMIPQITEATKAAVIDARRRGGQMKAAFG